MRHVLAAVGSLLLVGAVACSSAEQSDSAPLGNSSGKGGSAGRDAGTAGSGGSAGEGVECVEKSCTQLGANCGIAPDTCGGTVSCGDCPTGATCGGESPNRCGAGSCVPKTCAQLGAACGIVSDGCADVNDCGTCPSGLTCVVRNGTSYCSTDPSGGEGGEGGWGGWPGVGGSAGSAGSAGASGMGGSAGIGGSAGMGGSAGSAGSAGFGGSAGAAGSSGSGGTGGTSCNPADYCQMNNLSAGWYCNGSTRVLCATAGACQQVVEQQNCGAVGCSNGACNDACGTVCQGRCGTYQGCDCGGCGTNETCTNNQCVIACGGVCAGHCGSYQGCSCGGCGTYETCSNNQCVPDCGQICYGRCGSYQGCSCGGCGYNETCSNNQCVPDCGQICYGRCGSYQGCSCGGCSGSDVCSNNWCVECANGDTQSRSCDPGWYCPMGTQTRTCTGNSWGAYGQCAVGAGYYRFYGDGGTHCGSVLCLQAAPTGSNYDAELRVSKVNGIPFDNPVEIWVNQPGTSNYQYFGCQPVAGVNTIILHLNPSLFDIESGDTIAINAEVVSPCYGSFTTASEDAYISQCKP